MYDLALRLSFERSSALCDIAEGEAPPAFVWGLQSDEKNCEFGESAGRAHHLHRMREYEDTL